ncbi:MAG: phosphotransferase [Terracidiphilus sp.]
MRAMARLPRFLGSQACVESRNLETIREAIGKEAGLSSCRAGAPGPWSKDTILLLDENNAKPLYLVKAGAGEAVDALLRNEADWLSTLRDDSSLVDHIPELVAHRSGADLCFVAQRAISGDLEFSLGTTQRDFLCKLQRSSLRSMRFEDSILHRTLTSRIADLEGHLTEAWSGRMKKAMQKITEFLSHAPVLLVAAHNDFTPWNIRIENGRALVFDWEYAANEQLPLFDLLHFVLLPMALKSRPTGIMLQSMRETLQLGRQWLGEESCYAAETQALAYLMNVSTLYFWGARSLSIAHPLFESYADVIDRTLLQIGSSWTAQS